jgi:hypothetical protein
MSKIKFWGSKNWAILHDVEGQLAVGVPSVDVSIVLEFDEILEGTFARGKNHILRNKSASSYILRNKRNV